MSNNIQILYNGKDAFSGISPTPFVSLSTEYTEIGPNWNQITNITLDGQLTGEYEGSLSFNLLNNASKKLFDNFSQNYKTLQIIENEQTIYTADNAIIKSINIEDSSWYGILPFSIDISVYDQNLFQNYYGVVEPEETFSFEEEDDGNILNLQHSVSAKGIVANNNNAIENAKLWVLSRKSNEGDINTKAPVPILINNANSVQNRSFLLYSSEEIIDRFNGTYSWVGNYKKSLNLENPQNSILEYSVELNSGINDAYLTATINGTLQGNEMTILKQEYNKLDLYFICARIANDTFRSFLSSRSLSQSVEETEAENKLTFSSTFTNDFSLPIINNYTVDINEDSLNCIRTVNLSSTISYKFAEDISKKWDEVKSFYEEDFNPFNLANTEYIKEFTTKLNPTPLNESITFDEFNAQIKYSAQFNDKPIIISQDILNLTSNVTLQPSVNIHVANTSAFTPREHNIYNLNCANRTQINISVTAIVKSNKTIDLAESFAQTEINRIKSNYSVSNNVLLENKEISKNNDIKSVTINETLSFESNIFS